MSELLDLAQLAVEEAVRMGAEFVDVVTSRGRNLSVEIEKDAIKSSDARWNSGAGVRAFCRGGTGFSSTSGLDKDDIVQAARSAAEMAQAAEPDPDFIELPAAPDAYPEVEGLCDQRIEHLGIDQLITWCVQNIDAAKQVCSEAIIQGGGGAYCGESALANNRGVAHESRRTNIGLSIFSIIRRADDAGSFFDWDSARVMADFEPDDIGIRATEEALRFLGARKIETKPMTVIFGPLASSSLFEGLVENANAESIQRQRSFLIGMKGKQVASEIVTITDEPLIPRGLGSEPCDGEGAPHQPLVVVENGVLRTWLHNSYTANKAKEPNTGHSTRGGISSTNVIPKLGEVHSEQIIADTEEGLYLNSGSVWPHSVTGEVSATVDFGFKIEKGKLAYPVKSTMIGINFLELMKNVDAISSDYRAEPGAIWPTVRARNVMVAGGA